MKKIISLMLSLLIFLSLCGCNNENVKGKISKPNNKYKFGTTSEQTYENTFLGIGCKVPHDWKFYSEAEIKKINGIALDFADEKLAKEIEDMELIYDMYAYSSDGSANIVITLERHTEKEIEKLDVAKVMNGTLQALKKTEELEGEVIKIEMAGKKYTGLTITQKRGVNSMCQKQIALKRGEYLACVVVTAGSHNTVDNLIKTFYLL